MVRGIINEYTRRYSERLYGAFQLAATAMGVSTQKLNDMLENGEVLATDLIPKLTKVLEDEFAEAAESATKRTGAAFERLTNETIKLQRKLAKGFLGQWIETETKSLSGVIRGVNNVLDLLSDEEPISFTTLEEANKEIEKTKASITFLKAELTKANESWEKQFITTQLEIAETQLKQLINTQTQLNNEAVNGYRSRTQAGKAYAADLAKQAKERKKIEKTINDYILKQTESTKDRAIRINNALLVQAKKYGIDITALKKAQDDEISKIEEIGLKKRQKLRSSDTTQLQKQLQAYVSLKSSAEKALTTLTSKGVDQTDPAVIAQLQIISDIQSTIAEKEKKLADITKDSESAIIKALKEKIATATEVGTQESKTYKEKEKEYQALLKQEEALQKAYKSTTQKGVKKDQGLIDLQEQLKTSLGSVIAKKEELASRYKFASDKQKDANETLIESTNEYIKKQKESQTILESYILQLEKSSEPFTAFQNTATTALSSIEDSFVEMAQMGTISFSNLMDSIVSGLVRYMVQANITIPIATALNEAMTQSSSISGIFSSLLSGITGVSSSVSSSTSSVSLASSASSISLLAKGGVTTGLSSATNSIISSPTFFPDGSSSVKGFATGGIWVGEGKSSEAVLPLTRTSSGNLGVESTGSGSTTIEVNIYGGSSDTTVKQSTTSDGGTSIDVYIDGVVANAIGNGGKTYNTIKNVFGISRTLAGRG